MQQRVIDTLTTYFGFDPGAVKPGMNLEDDLCFDSLDKIEALIALEAEFDISLDDDEAYATKTVADVIALVEAAVATSVAH